MAELYVMTFNLRVTADCDGVNRFPNRAGKIAAFLRAEMPDLIGFQEVNDEMRAFLRPILGDAYTLVGCGRSADYHGESTVLAYRRDRFECVASENFWLSDTPDVPGSRFVGDQSECPRITTWVKLKHDEIETPFVFCNTHLDHKGRDAREKGARLLAARLAALGGKFILTGDFNALPDESTIGVLTAMPGVTDATASLGATYHGYGTAGAKIDYIFTNGEAVCASVAGDGPDARGIWLSDHYPVRATVKL